MGTLKNAYLASRGVNQSANAFLGGGSGGFIPTEPGDPNFSYSSTPDSQAQFPAAAAEKRLFDNKRSADNILAQAQAFGVDINSEEYTPIREAADSGVIERALTMGERLLGYIDGPRQAVNLFIQDIAGGVSGERDPNWLDYADALWGGIEREKREQFTAETGLDPVSGSRTLELFGWEPEDTTGGRFARGVADFGVQVLTDPLSYVTFGLSGLGKKVAQATALKIQTESATEILRVARGARVTAAKGFEEGAPMVRGLETSRKIGITPLDIDARRAAWYNLHPYHKRLVRELTDITRNFTNDVLMKADDSTIGALGTWLRKNKGIATASKEDILRYSHDYVQEIALHNRLAQDIMQPLLRRDFAAIAPDAIDLLPAYARGGARLSFPFLGTSSLRYGIDIPGTRGLGRRIVGDPARKRIQQLRQFSVFSKIFRSEESILNSMSTERALIRALGRGDIQGWQYHIAGHALDALRNSSQRDAAKVVINAEFQTLRSTAEALGVKDNGVLFTDLWNRIEKRATLGDQQQPSMLRNFLFQQTEGFEPPTALNQLEVEQAKLTAYDEQLDRVAELLSQTQDTYYRMLDEILPKTKDGRSVIGHIDDHIPHQTTDKGRLIIAQLAELGDVFPRAEMLRMQAEGHPGGVLLDELVNAVSRGGRIEQQIGATRYVDERIIGLTTAMAITDNGIIQMPKESIRRLTPRQAVDATGAVMTDNVKPSYMTVPELNAELSAAIRKIAAEPGSGIVLPRNWDGKIFNDNPLEVVGSYVDNLHEVVHLWQTVEALKMAGLAFPHSAAIDVGRTAQAIMENLKENTVKVTSATPFNELAPGTDILRGYKEALETASLHSLETARVAKAAGFDIFDVEGNKSLVSLLRKSLQEFTDWLSPYSEGPPLETISQERRAVQDLGYSVKDSKVVSPSGADFAVEVRTYAKGKDRATFINGGGILSDTPIASVTLSGKLGSPGMRLTVRQSSNADWVDDMIVDELDSLLRDGSNYTYTNISALLEDGVLNADATRALHTLLNRNLASLDDNTLQFMTNGEPAELTRLHAWFETFIGKLNKLIGGYGHYIDPESGQILPTSANPSFQLLADDGYENLLDETRKMAANAEIPGLEKIFKNVETYRGIADRKKFVNPAIFALGGPAVESLTLQKDVAQWLRQLARNSASIYTPEGVAALKLQTNAALRLWRGMATIMRPGFHVRNLIGGVWNNMLIGVRHRDYVMVQANGIKFRNALRRGVDPDEAFNLLDPHARKVFKAAWDNDVMTGFATSEFRKLSPSERASRWDFMKLWKDDFLLQRAGGKVMESIEDFLRVSAFAAWYDPNNPATAKVAKEMAEAVHFNYSNLTPLETKIKTFVPFFVWTRRNLPLQMRVFAENPRMVQRYRAMMQSMNDNLGGNDEGNLPNGDIFSAFAAGTDIKVHPNTPFWARVIIDPDLPVRDLVDLPGLTPPQLLEFANGLLGPHISTLVDMNREREFDDVNAPAPFNTILKGLAYVGFFDNTASGDVRIPYYLRTVIETGLPITRDVIEPFFGGPTDPARQQRAGISQDAGKVESGLTAIVASLARGAGIKLSTPTDVRQMAGRTDQDLDAALRALRFSGTQPASEGS